MDVFLIENDDLLEKYIIWDKVSTNIKREFDSEPVYNKIFLKTKIKSHGDEVTALKKDENYYLQVFLKECKFIEKKLIRHSNDNLIDFPASDDSDEEQLIG